MVNAALLLLAPLLNRLRFGGTTRRSAIAWSGVLAMAAGLGLRIWSARTLGAYYTRTLRTAQDQALVQDGPYQVVRHPGYLGTLLLWLGAGVASANWMVASLIAACTIPAYHQRIAAEEAMLAQSFAAEYPDYAANTWRILPFVY